MGSIIVDVDAVAEVGSSAGTIAAEFENANANSDYIAESVGHSGLSSTVSDFAHDWDDKRQKFTDALKALSDGATAVADSWVQFDQDGAEALTSTEGEGQ